MSGSWLLTKTFAHEIFSHQKIEFDDQVKNDEASTTTHMDIENIDQYDSGKSKDLKEGEAHDVNKIKLSPHEMKLISKRIAYLGQCKTSKAALIVDIRENDYATRDNYWPFRLRKFTDHSPFINPFLGSIDTANQWPPRLRGGADMEEGAPRGMVEIASL